MRLYQHEPVATTFVHSAVPFIFFESWTDLSTQAFARRAPMWNRLLTHIVPYHPFIGMFFLISDVLIPRSAPSTADPHGEGLVRLPEFFAVRLILLINFVPLILQSLLVWSPDPVISGSLCEDYPALPALRFELKYKTL